MKQLVTLYLDEGQRDLINSEAKRRGVWKSEIVRRALRQYLPKKKSGEKEAQGEEEQADGK